VGLFSEGPPPKRMFSPADFEKVVVDLESSEGVVAVGAANRGCVGAFARPRNAIEAANVGIDDADEMAAFDHPDAVRDLRVLAGVNVVAIEDDVIAMLGADHAVDGGVGAGGPLDADETDMVSDYYARIALHQKSLA